MYQVGDESLEVKLAHHTNDEVLRWVLVSNMDKKDVLDLQKSEVKNKNPISGNRSLEWNGYKILIPVFG